MTDEPDEEAPDEEIEPVSATRADLAEILHAAAPGSVADVTAALITALGADPLSGAVIGTFVGMGVALDQVIIRRRWDRVGKVLEDVSERLGGPDRLVEKVLASDEQSELTRRVLEAAARTTVPDKLRALGRVLAQGLDDTEHIDSSLLLAAALYDIEGPHVRALRIIEHLDDLAPEPGQMLMKYSGSNIAEIRPFLTGDEGVLEAVLGALSVHGLVRVVSVTHPGETAPRYLVTDLGRGMIQLLEEAAE